MTREERESCIGTIELLRRLAFNIHGVMDVIDAENCDKMIKVLKSETAVSYLDGYNDGYKEVLKAELCEDAISRSDVLDAFGHGTTYTSEDLQRIIKALPPVNPQPKVGHWIFDEILDKHYYCSECKSMGVDYWDFCPNCGCRMVEPQAESEDKEWTRH